MLTETREKIEMFSKLLKDMETIMNKYPTEVLDLRIDIAYPAVEKRIKRLENLLNKEEKKRLEVWSNANRS